MGWNQGYCSIVVEILFIKQNPSSSVAPLTCGVPQSSILGLLSFYVYITYISPIFITTVMQTTYKCMLHTGVSYCQKWLFQNIVKVNKNKTDIIILGSPKSVTIFQKHLTHCLQMSNLYQETYVWYLTVTFHFEKQVTKYSNHVFYQLKSILKIRLSLCLILRRSYMLFNHFF